MLGWTKWAIAIAIAGLAMGGAAPAIAGDTTVPVQRLGPPDVEARREALLKQMLARPNDLDLAFEYATLSSQVGDYEGAVSTLERMLIYAPNTPRLQLELGILYYKLGAYDVARAYFEQALANPSVPPSVAAQVRLYLQQLALAADPPAFSASIFSAIRWESNANAGPGTQSVTLNGIDFTLDQQSVGREGWSALNIGTMHYGWDLKRQGDRIEFDALAYSTAYFDKDLNDIDLDFFEVTLGPSFNMKRWNLDKTRTYLYAIGDLAYLGYDPYFSAPGAGFRLLSFGAAQSVLDARIETRWRDFENSSDLPFNSDAHRSADACRRDLFLLLHAGLRGDLATLRSARERRGGVLQGLGNRLLGRLCLDLRQSALAGALSLDLPGGRRRDSPGLRRSRSDHQSARGRRRIPSGGPAARWFCRWPRPGLWCPRSSIATRTSNYDIRAYDDLMALVGVQKRF